MRGDKLATSAAPGNSARSSYGSLHPRQRPKGSAHGVTRRPVLKGRALFLATSGPAIALNLDHALAALGVVAAIGSAAFAAHMVIHNGSATGLASFDSPIGQSDNGASEAGSVGEPGARQHDLPIDEMGIVTLPSGARRSGKQRSAPHEPLANASIHAPPSALYRLRFVHNGMALVQGAGGLYVAWPGAQLPGVGRVLSLEKRGSVWRLITDRAIIAEIGSKPF